jgi:hypothetical protein
MEVFKEMERVIKNVVTKSFADQSYDKAIKALKQYRSEAIEVFPIWGVADISLMNRVISMISLNLLRRSYLLARLVGIGTISGNCGNGRKSG